MTVLKAVRWGAIAAVGTLIVLTIAAAAGSRTEPLRELVVATLVDRLGTEVELRSFSVDTFPQVVVNGYGLKLRFHDQDSTIPPLIEIERFTVHSSLFDLLRRPRRFREVTLEGLVVNIPPGGIKGAGADAGAAEEIKPRDRGKPGQSPIIVDVLHANGALLRIIPRKAGKNPKEFAIHALTMRTLGLAQEMPFTATLTNPVPKGLIETDGTFGPWQKDSPGSTPLAGRYSFQKADLNTIKGIGGILDSLGDFGGRLDRIQVKGTTSTPDFQVDVSGQPVALNTTFTAVVDGTDGDTYLEEVNAQFLKTFLTARGAVVGKKGVKGRTVDLKVHVTEGRIEDLLRLSTKSEKPLMVGRVQLETDFLLPPGEPDVIERLQLAGKFDVGAATFTDRGVQQKLTGMSKRARGLDQEESAGNVVSNLSGTFRLDNARLRFSRLSFSMPGAGVLLNGSYGLRSEEMEFDGTLRMQATISEAAGGGAKGFFLKMVDPIFRKKGSGAVVPIKIRGTRDDPKFGLDVGRVLKRK